MGHDGSQVSGVGACWPLWLSVAELPRLFYRQEAHPPGSVSITATEKAVLLALLAALGTCGPVTEEVWLPACPRHCQLEEAESQGSWWMFQSPHKQAMARFRRVTGVEEILEVEEDGFRKKKMALY